MFTPQQINQRIKEIENSYHRGEMDLTESTAIMEEVLKEYTGEDRVIPMRDFKLPPDDGKNSFHTGIALMDEITGKLRKGDIFTITAASGIGKSTFARELLIRFSANGKKCLYFSYEDTNAGLIEKLGEDIPDGYIPNVLNDKSLTWIEARILEGIVKYGIEIVFIDNLKAITDFTARNVNNAIESTMQRIKNIAMKHNVMIFLCAHIRKEEGKSLDINSIKDSTAIADTSSIVIAIRRLADENQTKKDIEANGVRMTNLTLFSIIKNRNNGQQDSFRMLFRPNGISGRYDENTNIFNENA